MTVLVNFPDLSARASWLIATLAFTWGIPCRYSTIAEAFHPRASSLRSTGKAPYCWFYSIKCWPCSRQRGSPRPRRAWLSGQFMPV